jgi:hypothetical protein
LDGVLSGGAGPGKPRIIREGPLTLAQASGFDTSKLAEKVSSGSAVEKIRTD